MLVLLSPAKSMCTYGATQFRPSCPVLLDKTDTLIKVMKGKSKGDIKSLMHISDAVASLNYDRYQGFISNESGEAASAVSADKHTSDSTFKVTSLVFDGPAYRGFSACTFTVPQYEYAQKHVRILSGLYGILKPWDIIQEYRLEMGTKLSVSSTGTLYDYWGATIAETLLADLTDQTIQENTETDELSLKKEKTKKVNKKKSSDENVLKSENENENENQNENENENGSSERSRVKVVVNLASQEYFRSVQKNVLQCDKNVRIVECVFKHQGRVLSVYAKRARGLMARYIVTHSINPYTSTSTSTSSSLVDSKNSDDDAGIERAFQNCLEQLKGFNLEGYSYQPSVSTDKCMVFNRSELPPNTLGCDDDGEDEDGDGEKTTNKKIVKKTKTASVSNDTKIVVEESNEKKNGIKIVAKKKGGKDEAVAGEDEEDVQEEKKGRSTSSRSVKVLGTKIEVKSGIDVKVNKKLRGKKAVQNIEEDEVEENDEVEVKSDKIETKGKAKGNGRAKRTQDSALSLSNIDDKQEAVKPYTEHPIPTAKRARSSRIIK